MSPDIEKSLERIVHESPAHGYIIAAAYRLKEQECREMAGQRESARASAKLAEELRAITWSRADQAERDLVKVKVDAEKFYAESEPLLKSAESRIKALEAERDNIVRDIYSQPGNPTLKAYIDERVSAAESARDLLAEKLALSEKLHAESDKERERWEILSRRAYSDGRRDMDGVYAEKVAILAEKLGRLAREVSVTLDQWAHEREQGRSGVVYGSRIGLLREALAIALATDDKPAAPAEKP